MDHEKEMIDDLDGVICSIEGCESETDQAAQNHMSIGLARHTARMTRRGINDFRDDHWEKMIQSKEHIVAAIVTTTLTVYLLLWISIIWGARRDIILTVTIYYLIGAAVGLFNHLHIESQGNEDKSVDDYGASQARLFVTILLSGLAAVGGVVVTAIFTLTQTGQTGAGDVGPKLVDYLRIEDHPLNILVALTFGLTPRALISRLKEQADENKSAIRTSRITSTVKTPPDESG
jgi:hypothetical protein